MDITKEDRAKIAAGAWLEDVGRFQASGGKDYNVCTEMAAIKMVESQLPIIPTDTCRVVPGIASRDAALERISAF